jgi:tetratricopeptide (TPR) repeat protein
VPNLINQGGLSAYRAAEVLFANCRAAEAAGRLEGEIVAAELGLGLGLFSLQLLDRFRQLAQAAGSDYYERLTFYATDVTPKMLEDARASGIFARHRGRVVLGQLNALEPGSLVRSEDGRRIDLKGRLRAIFHSYVLCVLPAGIYQRRRRWLDGRVVATEWLIVLARTLLGHPEELATFTTLSAADLARLAGSGNVADQLALAPLYPLLDLDLTLVPLEIDGHAGAAELERIADAIADADVAELSEVPQSAEREERIWIHHSGAALHSLRRQLDLLVPDGFILYRDYGPASAKAANGTHLYQHYGTTTAVGVNHFALDGHFAADPGRATIVAPLGEGEASIKARLLSGQPLPETREAFLRAFDPRAFAALEEAVAAARQAVQAGQPEAVEAYRHALRLERDNWLLLQEAGEVALRRFKNLDLARMLLSEAVRINPCYATTAWNLLGDVCWYEDRLDEAEQAYLRASRANPEDHRAWMNLYDLHRRRGNLATAIEMAARAMALDVEGRAADVIRPAIEETLGLLQRQRETAARLRRERKAGAPF